MVRARVYEGLRGFGMERNAAANKRILFEEGLIPEGKLPPCRLGHACG